MENKELINQRIDRETRKLVGILCKRVEVLEKHKALTPNLYKDIVKENIYEFGRQLKEVLNTITINFVTPKKQNKSA